MVFSSCPCISKKLVQNEVDYILTYIFVRVNFQNKKSIESNLSERSEEDSRMYVKKTIIFEKNACIFLGVELY